MKNILRDMLFMSLLTIIGYTFIGSASAQQASLTSTGVYGVFKDFQFTAADTRNPAQSLQNTKASSWEFSLSALVPTKNQRRQLGIVWTDNNWATRQTTFLQYDNTYSADLQQWRSENVRIGVAQNTAVTIQYAILYEIAGQIYRDDRNGRFYQVNISPA